MRKISRGKKEGTGNKCVRGRGEDLVLGLKWWMRGVKSRMEHKQKSRKRKTEERKRIKICEKN
jgi:hypothetical protein